ncbi:MAG: hypothetical protein AAFY97_01050 [Pseudomonadota bacterium]
MTETRTKAKNAAAVTPTDLESLLGFSAPDLPALHVPSDDGVREGALYMFSEGAPQGSVFFGSGPLQTADSGEFREWLLHHRFDVLSINTWEGADFAELRALVLAILALSPGIRIVFRGPPGPAFKKSAETWPDQVSIGSVSEPLPLHVAAPRAAVRDTRAAREESELRDVMDEIAVPDIVERVELKMIHAREECDGEPTRPWMDLDNALLPDLSGTGPAGLHLGDGLVLRAVPSSPSRFEITRLPGLEAGMEAKSVRFDPRPGKALKHERVLGLSQSGRVTTVSELRVIGHGAHHIFMRSGNEAADVVGVGSFVFSEGGKLLGVVTEHHAALGQIFSVLRTGAMWDDLVTRADLGCAQSADTLQQLESLQHGISARFFRRRASRASPQFASPANAASGR